MATLGSAEVLDDDPVAGPAAQPEIRTNPKDTAQTLTDSVSHLVTWNCPDIVKTNVVALLAAIRHTVTSDMTAGKPMISDKLLFFLLKHGHRYRSHSCELFYYDRGSIIGQFTRASPLYNRGENNSHVLIPS